MRYEEHNFDGNGYRRVAVYDLTPTAPFKRLWGGGFAGREYWPSVTDVPCPIERCSGIIRWAENSYVPGYRICDVCGKHFHAGGTAEAPVLIRVHDRRGGFLATHLKSAAKNLREHMATYGGRFVVTDHRITVEIVLSLIRLAYDLMVRRRSHRLNRISICETATGRPKNPRYCMACQICGRGDIAVVLCGHCVPRPVSIPGPRSKLSLARYKDLQGRIWGEFALLYGSEECQECEETIVAGYCHGDNVRCYT